MGEKSKGVRGDQPPPHSDRPARGGGAEAPVQFSSLGTVLNSPVVLLLRHSSERHTPDDLGCRSPSNESRSGVLMRDLTPGF